MSKYYVTVEKKYFWRSQSSTYRKLWSEKNTTSQYQEIDHGESRNEEERGQEGGKSINKKGRKSVGKRKRLKGESLELQKRLLELNLSKKAKGGISLKELDLSKIFTVGSELPRNFTNRWQLDTHAKDVIQKLLVEIPAKNKLWLNLTTETVANPTTDQSVKRENDENVPILVVTSCEVIPTVTVSNFDMQTQTEEIRPMSNYKLSWVVIPGTNDRVFMLRSTSTLDYSILQRMLLYQRQPQKLNSDQPNKIEAVDVMFNETLVIWHLDCSNVQSCVNDEFEDNENWDKSLKPKLETLFRSKYREMQESENDDFQRKKEIYSREMNKRFEQDRSNAETALDNMKLYKIYPSNTELESMMTLFGPTGFI